MKLRPYQGDALESLWAWFRRHDTGNPIVEACVGAGKSVLIAALCQEAMRNWPGTRILVVAHQKELLQQNLDKLKRVWPDAPVGIHSAGVGKKDIGHDVLYATIGSIYKKAHLLGHVDLILADECHLINTKEEGMWRELIGGVQKYCPNVRVIGWTGTPFRGNGVWLTAGDNPLFHGVACRITMRDLLAQGFLAPLTSRPTATQIDTSGVGTTGGDFNVGELADVSDREEIINAACDESVVLAGDRKRWLAFCVTVEHAHHVRDALAQRGVFSEVVSANTTKAERERIIDAYRQGHIRCLCNVGVLTTGFDVPEVDCIILLRSTKSPVLYVQIMGRGMRVVGANIDESIANGKSNCLVLDFTDTCARMGPVDLISGRMPRRSSQHDMPMKICETCGSLNAVSARECIDCGAPFDIEEQQPHGVRVSGAAVISAELAAVRYPVTGVTYAKHNKPGKPPTLRVEYWSGLRIVAKEWVGIESENYGARSRASHWWWKRRRDTTPDSVDEALQHTNELTKPTAIVVNEVGKYPDITGYEWATN